MRLDIAQVHHAPTPMLRNLRARSMAGLGQSCEWILQPNGSYYWGEYVGNEGGYQGCPTPAPSAPPTSPSNTAAQNIADQFQAYADDPNLNSPAYLAAEAADTGESVSQLGTNTSNALSTLATYCQQNLLNNEEFGDPVDISTCGSGGQPMASSVATVSSVTTPNYPTTVTPVASAAPAPAVKPAPVVQQSQTPVVSTPATTPTTSAGSSISSFFSQIGNDISGAGSSSGSDWFTQSSIISGFPNWGIVAAGVVALLVLPSLLGGRR